jgi:hypothetical protein
MAKTIILVDKFYAIRKLLKDTCKAKKAIRRSKIQNSNHLYIRQRQGRVARQVLMKSDPRFAEFFAWVFSLQKRLKASDKQFGKLCGVSAQTIKLWRNFDSGCGGYFPSEKTFKVLLRLEIVSLAKVKIIKREINVKNKKFPKSKVQIPRLKRLQANIPY